MNRPPTEHSETSAPSVLRWPWGQFGWFLTGLAISLKGIEDFGMLWGMIAPTTGDEPSFIGTLGGLLILAAIVCSVPAGLLRWGILRRREPPTHLAWLRKVNFGLLAFAILSVMLALFIPAIHAARIAQQQSLTSGPWREHSVAGGAVQLSTPPSWEIVQGPNSSASGVQMIDRQNDLSLTVVLVSKQDLAVQLLTELAHQSALSLAENLIDPAAGEMVSGELEGNRTVDIVQSGTLKGMNLVWYTRHVEYPDAWVELRMWATRSRYETHSETFARIATSIRRGK